MRAAENLGRFTLDCRSVELPAHPNGEVRELWTGRLVPAEAVGGGRGARGVLPGSSALAFELEAARRGTAAIHALRGCVRLPRDGGRHPTDPERSTVSVTHSWPGLAV